MFISVCIQHLAIIFYYDTKNKHLAVSMGSVYNGQASCGGLAGLPKGGKAYDHV